MLNFDEHIPEMSAAANDKDEKESVVRTTQDRDSTIGTEATGVCLKTV